MTRPIAPAEAERINWALAQALGGDPSGGDLTQVLRVPGTTNDKYVHRPQVRLVALDTQTAIDPDTLVPSLSTRAAAADVRPTAAAALPERIVEGSRNIWLASLAGSLQRRGLGCDEILAVLRLLNQRRCEPPLDDGELVRIARSIVRYPPGSTGMSRITVEVL